MSKNKPGRHQDGGAPGGTARSGLGGRIEIAPPAEIDIATDRLGTVLSERRSVLGLKIEEIAEDIKIRPEYLRALEDEALETLPTPEYGRLFLKSYAERLGIDVSEAYALLDLCERPRKAGPAGETAPESGARPATSGNRRFPVVWVSAAGIVIVVIVIWAVLRSAGESPRTEETLRPAENTGTRVTETIPAPEPEALPVPTDQPMHLELSFDRDTWVVLVADGDTVVYRNLYAGDVAEATATNRFTLTLGHTDGVAATVNGQPLVPFRARASRLSGVVITADSVEAWLDTTMIVPEAESESSVSKDDSISAVW